MQWKGWCKMGEKYITNDVKWSRNISRMTWNDAKNVCKNRQTDERQINGQIIDRQEAPSMERWEKERKENQRAMLCWPNAKIITAVNGETKDQFVRLSRKNVKLKQPALLNRLFNMSNIVSNMGIMNKNAREEGYRVTVYDNKRFPALQ